MVTLKDVCNAVVPKINHWQAQGYKLGDLQIVLGHDTFTAIKIDPIFAQEQVISPAPALFGVDFVVDTSTPRLHSVRVKISRKRTNA